MSTASFWGVFLPMVGAAVALLLILAVAAVLARRDGIREQSRD